MSPVSSAAGWMGPPLDAYVGLGSWVDVYDTPAWRDPSGAVRDMARHGVRTLYIETGSYGSRDPIFKPAALRTFIAAAHANHMRVVAWYLPNMKPRSVDYARIEQAIRFHTADGQHFDSFALDIEATAISSYAVRNRGLETLTKRIRKLVGPKYALGAIIPAPVGLAKKRGYWDAFPYTMLAENYDVFLPMGYYTYHTSSASGAYADARANVRILRSQTGCSVVPIHLIGGIAENSNARGVAAFVRATREDRLLGASLYGWAGTSAGEWRALSAIGK